MIKWFCAYLASDTSLEDTQASYTERLREKSRSISMNGNNDMNGYLARSISKDALNDCNSHTNLHINITEFPLTSESILRPKSSTQQSRTIQMITKPQTENSDTDFHLKRDYFENRLYVDNASTNSSLLSIPANILPTKPKVYSLSPSNPPINNNNSGLLQHTTLNNNPQRNVTR